VKLLNLSAEELREASHRPEEFFGPSVKHAAPDHRQGPLAVRFNTLRTMVRQVEISAAKTFIAADMACSRPDILKGLNRLSSAMYVMHCLEVGKNK
jgi:ethanolamine utilization cobalamin adenosyltransferase